MNDTYLTLQGWMPLRFTESGSTAFFLYNPYFRIVINKNGVLYNETITEESFRTMTIQLSEVTFNDIPQQILDQAINLILVEGNI